MWFTGRLQPFNIFAGFKKYLALVKRLTEFTNGQDGYYCQRPVEFRKLLTIDALPVNQGTPYWFNVDMVFCEGKW